MSLSGATVVAIPDFFVRGIRSPARLLACYGLQYGLAPTGVVSSVWVDLV